MTQELQIQKEREELIKSLSEESGVGTRTYEMMPSIRIFNPSKEKKMVNGVAVPDEFKIGDFVKSQKTEQGWTNEKVENIMTGYILKVRMFLRSKYKYQEGLVSNEFDNYSNSIITVKEKVTTGNETNCNPVFTGTYKEVGEEYSIKDNKGKVMDKKLDLHFSVYILTDMVNGTVVRLEFKGLSRSNFFKFMQSFTRRNGDHMAGYNVTVFSDVSTVDDNGVLRQAPIAAFGFKKDGEVDTMSLVAIKEIQNEFKLALEERDAKFGNASAKKELGEGEQPSPTDDYAQGEPDTLPTINLDEDEIDLDKLPK